MCGNGGSASDSQHLAAEFIGRFEKNRTPLKSISLNTDTSVMTALSNDYSYDILFQRQLQALGSKNDLLIAISTSGNSKNILNVLKEARKKYFFRLSPWKRWRRGKEIFRLKYYSPLKFYCQNSRNAYINWSYCFSLVEKHIFKN